jgi:CheY-like chemotaxis protein
MQLWLIDDDPGNHAAARATLRAFPQVVFSGFLAGAEALAAAAAAGAGQRPVPEVVLMDFYLGDTRGDQVTAALLPLLAQRRPVVVGYSSVTAGSERIVAAGGGAIVRKRTAPDGTNPFLAAFLAQRLGA